MPCSGRTSAASNSGSPIGPLRTASDALHAASVSSGRGVARVADRLRPERVLLELEIGGDLLEGAKRFAHHLGADPVAGKNNNRHVSTPSRAEHSVRVRLDPDRLEPRLDRAGRFQAVARDDEDDAVVLAELALLDCPPERAEETPAAVSPKTPACCARTLMFSPTSSSGTA